VSDRSTDSTATFTKAFTLASLGVELPAGTYRVVTDEVEIPGLSFLAYAHQATMLYVPAIGSHSGHREVHTIDHAELARALALDTQPKS